MSRRLKFMLALLPQVAVLGAIVAREEYVLRQGQEVVLEIGAVDPPDALSGWYQDTVPVISRLERARLAPGEEPQPGDVVYVLVRPNAAGVHEAIAIRRERPAVDEMPFLRADVLDVVNDTLWLEYGLSRFHVAMDARDPNLERRPDGSPHELRLVVRVVANGDATAADLLVDGVPFAAWNRGG